VTGHDHDPYNDWVCIEYDGRIFWIMRRGTLTLCMWWAVLAVSGWLLTQLIAA
jgi:hypothetical protein